MPTNDEKSRFVSEKLGMWKEGEKCKRHELDGHCSIHPHKTSEHGWEWHQIPPPDLTTPAGADALMTALAQRCIYFGAGIESGVVASIDDDDRTESWGNDWREALLDATYCLLSGSESQVIR